MCSNTISVVHSIGFVSAIVIFLSNMDGVPQGVTGAPTEVAHNSCGSCHLPPSNYVVSNSFVLKNKDNQSVTSYNPGEIYTLNLQLSATNNPKSFGFQLTVIDDVTKTDCGVWTKLGEQVKQLNLVILQKQRRYLSHSSPKVDGLFTAEWKAPESDLGDITFYYAGLAVNLNGNNSGDKHTNGIFKLKSQLSSNLDVQKNTKSILYPNPAMTKVSVLSDLSVTTDILDHAGRSIISATADQKTIDIAHLSPGLFIYIMKDKNGSIVAKQKLIKL